MFETAIPVSRVTRVSEAEVFFVVMRKTKVSVKLSELSNRYIQEPTVILKNVRM
jgi:hypothetical protein